MLLVSRVTALALVWGKLVASVAFMLLLILAALPLFAAVFLFGGIDFEQFVVTQLVTVTTAVSVGAVSLLMSAAYRRTLASTVSAYALTFAGLVGTLAVGTLLSFVILQRAGAVASGSTPVHPFVFFNPLYALFVVLAEPSGAPLHVGQLVALLLTLPGRGLDAGPALEPWQGTILVQMVVIVASVLAAVRLVGGRRPRRRDGDGAEAEPEVAAELDMDEVPVR